MEYDLTGMAGEVAKAINGDGIGPLTEAQRRKVDKAVEKYAKRAVKIIVSHI